MLSLRRAFTNWLSVGIFGGIASPSALRIPWIPASLARRRIIARTREGVVLETRAENVTAIIEVFRNGEYDIDVPWQEMETIVDIGAHVGSFTCWAARRATQARIVAVEPDRRNVADLRLNVARNDLTKRVAVIEGAVAETRGEGTLLSPDRGELARLDPEASEGCVVRTYPLNDIVRTSAAIDLLKLDCEGAEWRILPAAGDHIWAKVRAIVIEVHSQEGQDPETLLALLRDHGFAVSVMKDTDAAGTAFARITTAVGRRK